MEDMDDDIAEIDDDPLTGREAVFRLGMMMGFIANLQANLRGNGLELRFRCGGANDKEVGKRGNPPHIEDDDILRLFVQGRQGTNFCQ